MLALAVGFGAALRSGAGRAARRQGFDIEIGSVRPAWHGARLLDVRIVSRTDGRVHAMLREVTVGLNAWLQPDALELRGGVIEVEGLPAQLRGRAEPSSGARDHPGRPSPEIRGEDLVLSWKDADHLGSSVQLAGVSFDHGSLGWQLRAGRAIAESGRAHLSVEDLRVDGGPGLEWRTLHARAMTVSWAAVPRAEQPVEARPEASAGSQGNGTIQELLDPRRLRVRVDALAAELFKLMPPGARGDVGALTWQWGASQGGGADLTLGPGAAAAHRNASSLELTYSAGEHDGRAVMTFHALLPVDATADTSLSLAGGPVALDRLGLQEGDLGFVSTDRATLAGRAQVTLAGAGDSLSFDLDGAVRNLSLVQLRVAAEPVRGIDAQLIARGALDAQRNLRFDELSATLGLFHLQASGVLQQGADQLSAAFRFELPSTQCQALLDSMPTALLPALQGTTWQGDLGAQGRFAFNTNTLDQLELDYRVQDQCRASAVPSALARARFKQPFRYRIYLPDGSPGEQTSGPGSLNWTALSDISPYLQIAVLTTEDGAFSHHRGFNRAAIKASIIANLKARHFVRGASTISMQLAKNLFLSREKTLSRKLEEVVLTDYLEQVFSKDEIMELYLNVVEFGPGVYGVTAASQYYFGRAPPELNLAESLFLSSLLPSPKRYGAMRDADEAPESWMKGLRNLMRIARKRGLLTDAEFEEGLDEHVAFWHGAARPPQRPPVRRRSPLEGPDEDVVPDAP